MAYSPAAEHDLDEEGVRALLVAGAPDLAGLPLRLVSEGWDNMMWRLGDALAVRVPRRELAVPLLAHEQRALPVIGPRLAERGVRAPVPVVAGSPTAHFPWPWSVVPWIDGTTAIDLPPAGNAEWATELASALDALHVPAPADAPANPVRGVPLARRDEAMTARLASHDLSPVLTEAWAAGQSAPPSSERVWIHGDLHPGNIVVDTGSLVAFIDFGDVTAGDPAYDLGVAWMLFDAAGGLAFRRATGDRYDDATWVRARAWAAYVAVVLLTQSDDRPDFQALGRRTAAALTER